jgi:RNA repair, ligase-Pnkp-associating, region of Hen1
MLLTITTTHVPATDLGYLLHKHPARVQTFALRGCFIMCNPHQSANHAMDHDHPNQRLACAGEGLVILS